MERNTFLYFFILSLIPLVSNPVESFKKKSIAFLFNLLLPSVVNTKSQFSNRFFNAKQSFNSLSFKEYFSDEEEMAVIMYLKTEDSSEKNRIYNEILKPAFEKMAESIIRRYKLYVPDETFEETFNDALSFIITKADKYRPIIFSYKEVEKRPNSTKKTYKEIRQEEFDVLNEDVCEDSPSLIKFYDYDSNEDRYFEKTRKKYKAYSYYGTICKNYLIGKIQTYNKGTIRNEPYEENVGLFIKRIN